MSVKIMVDSASDFTAQQAKEQGVLFVPLTVHFDGTDYYDGVDLLPAEFYSKLEKCKTMPRTSMVNEFAWSEAFAEATADGSEVVVITISSKLSGTYGTAIAAAEKFNGKVYVVDSQNAACGEGVIAQYAIRLRDEGWSAKAIFDELEAKKSRACVYAVIDTLKYLKKGGRISAASAFIGTTLSIKPLIGVIDGELKVMSKAFGNKRGNALLNNIVKNDGGIDFSLPWVYLWSGNDTKNVERYIQETNFQGEGNQAPLRIFGCTVGTHMGPGAVGLAYFKNAGKE